MVTIDQIARSGLDELINMQLMDAKSATPPIAAELLLAQQNDAMRSVGH
jgi:hypothetical protein